MPGKITIENKSDQVVEINIEGVIGVPEKWQFEDPGQRIATYDSFRSVVESIKQLTVPEIIINIRSSGGNVNDAILIYDAITALNASVTTRCYGYTASAATIIAQAASEGCREVSVNGLYLVHNSQCQTEGNVADIEQTIDVLRKTDERIANIYSSRSGLPEEKFTQLMNENNGNGKWLSAEEVIGFGLADKKICDRNKIEPDNVNRKGKLFKRLSGVVDNLGLKFTEKSSGEQLYFTNYMDFENLQLMNEVKKLADRIESLESENAQLRALPTRTQPKEDPPYNDMIMRRPNEQAYIDDLKKFIKN